VRPWFLHLILALLMIGVPAGGRFGAVQLDEDHEKERSETTTKQSAGERFEQRPIGGPRVRELPVPRLGDDPGFQPTLHARAAELALRGSTERRML